MASRRAFEWIEMFEGPGLYGEDFEGVWRNPPSRPKKCSI